jgi:hypothetical protein
MRLINYRRSDRDPLMGLAVLLWLALGAGVLPLAAQEAETPSPPPVPAPVLYLHIAGGLGIDLMSCPGINDLVTPLKGGGLGLNLSAGVRTGFKNIVQLEYRTDAAYLHDFLTPEEDANIEMTHKAPWALLIKFNPLFLKGDPGTAWFLVFGLGRNAKYFDKNDHGWKSGDLTVYGLEYDKITRSLEVGVGLEYRTVTYGRIDMPAFPAAVPPYKASFIVAAVHFGIGLGF